MRDGRLASGPIQEFLEFIDASGGDHSGNAFYPIDILDIATTAVTKTVAIWQGTRFTGYHTFSKTGKGWKMAKKMFHGNFKEMNHE